MTPTRTRTAAEIVDFTWWAVGNASYDDAESDPLISARPDFPYRPLQEHPALFVRFADLPGSLESFTEFMVEYGCLTVPEGDRLSVWRAEHDAMQEAVALFEGLDSELIAGRRDETKAELADLINAGLARHGVNPEVVPSRVPRQKGYLSHRVRDLAGAMWLQIAVAVDGDRQYAVCPVCLKRYDATDATDRREFCGDKCRAKAHYRRRKGGETHDNS